MYPCIQNLVSTAYAKGLAHVVTICSELSMHSGQRLQTYREQYGSYAATKDSKQLAAALD